MVFLKFLILTVFLHVAAKATTASPSPSLGFDVNDVSILFRVIAGGPLPKIGLQAASFLTDQQFHDVLTFEMPKKDLAHLPYLDGAIVNQKRNWFVTSLRVDPCGEVFAIVNAKSAVLEVAQSPGCQARLRVVAQPFNSFGHPLPSALHLLYRLDTMQLDSLVKELENLKRTLLVDEGIVTTDRPLSIYPALESTSEAVRNKAAELIQKLVLDQVTELNSQLEIVTVNLQSTFNHWRLTGGLIVNGEWHRFVTSFSKNFYIGNFPSVTLGVEELSCDLNPVCRFQPRTTVAQNTEVGKQVTYIFSDDADLLKIQVPDFRDEEIERLAEDIDNPQKTHFFNTNCMSCHQSANLRNYGKLYSSFDFQNGATPFVPKRFLSQNVNTVINFGYQGLHPRISTRTAAESVLVAKLLNEKRGISNPAKDRVLEDFWKCLTSSNQFLKCI